MDYLLYSHLFIFKYDNVVFFSCPVPISQTKVTVNNLKISTTFNIRAGRLVHLNCSSTGYPPPSYHWTYPGGESTSALLNTTFTRNNGSISCRSYHVMYALNGTNNTHVTEKKLALNISVLCKLYLVSYACMTD